MHDRSFAAILPALLLAACAAAPERAPPAKTIVIPKAMSRACDDHHYAPAVRVGDTVIVSGIPAWTAVGTTALLAEGAPVEMRVVAVVGAGANAPVERAP